MSRNTDVRKRYSQEVLSGWSNNDKSGKESSGNPPGKDKANGEVPKAFWEQGRYIAFIPVVIEPSKLSDTDYECSVSIAADVDIPIRLYRNRSKKMSQYTTYILAETNRPGKASIRMGARISEKGPDALSLTSDASVPDAIAHIYSGVMVTVNRAFRCFVYELARRQNETDERSGKKRSPSRKSVRGDKKKRRGKAVYEQVLLEEGTKESSQVAGLDGEILGHGQGDGES